MSKEKIDKYLESIPLKRDSISRLLLTLMSPGDNTVILRCHIRELVHSLRALEYKIATQAGQSIPNPEGAYWREVGEDAGSIKSTAQLELDQRSKLVELCLKNQTLKQRSKHIKTSRKIASTEFVGNVWREMGILEQTGARPQEIRPGHFWDQTLTIPLTEPLVLGGVQFLKTIATSKKLLNNADRIQ
ncbi:hypothetical protein RFI_06846 [Reticulomyxa filosa]|uniref:Uncharacterized protein n=1 Tax=Reticulomyxa filosa TaxID=46433 RepID=X6NVE0_RETFI|nr:hypothetical protein RFI_06846 [Reticulomyxa filosa]|eukprot:ETO30275.1 hypothetical protein RFI_06846 [Reticulomyxa filosa]